MSFTWDFMVFELSGNRLNEYGALVVTEQNISANGVVGEANTHTLLTDRLYVPTATERFASL